MEAKTNVYGISAERLLKIVWKLDTPAHEVVPLTLQLEKALSVGPMFGRASYKDQKHHWVRWLSRYQSPERSARSIYNAINCPPMLFWLAEASGASQDKLVAAFNSAVAAPPNQPAQTATIRKVLPFETVVIKLHAKGLTSA